jgi:hypothetical protein
LRQILTREHHHLAQLLGDLVAVVLGGKILGDQGRIDLAEGRRGIIALTLTDMDRVRPE